MFYAKRILNRAPLVWSASSRCSHAEPVVRDSVTRSVHLCSATAAGHNKWSKIKRPKFAADQLKSKMYAKLSVEIASSIRQAGDNPSNNYRLSKALSRARKTGMPKATIEKAIASGTGATLKEGKIEKELFEGKGPGKCLLLIETLTTSRVRTKHDLYALFKNKGSLGEAGSSMFAYDQKGVVIVPKESIPDEIDIEELAIEVGAEDIQCEEDDEEEQQFLFICDPQELKIVTEALKSNNLSVVSSTLEYIPKMSVALEEEDYQKALSFVDTLREHKDVIKVYENLELRTSENM